MRASELGEVLRSLIRIDEELDMGRCNSSRTELLDIRIS